jgi:hypothetical protein
VHARTNGGLAGSYGRVGPAGRAHCSTCAGVVETTMHMYLHCPLHHAPRVRLLQAVDAWRQAQASDAFTGEPALAPSRLEALRWVHSDSALVEGLLEETLSHAHEVGLPDGGFDLQLDPRFTPSHMAVPPVHVSPSHGDPAVATESGFTYKPSPFLTCTSSSSVKAVRHNHGHRFHTLSTAVHPAVEVQGPDVSDVRASSAYRSSFSVATDYWHTKSGRSVGSLVLVLITVCDLICTCSARSLLSHPRRKYIASLYTEY